MLNAYLQQITRLQTRLVSIGLCSFCPWVLFWGRSVQTIEGSVLQIRGELNWAASVDCLSRFRGCGCIQLWREAFLMDRVSRYGMIPTPPPLPATENRHRDPWPRPNKHSNRMWTIMLYFKVKFLHFRKDLTGSRLTSGAWMPCHKCGPGSEPTAWCFVGILIYSGPCTVQVDVAVHDEPVFCAKDSCVSKAACIMAFINSFVRDWRECSTVV